MSCGNRVLRSCTAPRRESPIRIRILRRPRPRRLLRLLHPRKPRRRTSRTTLPLALVHRSGHTLICRTSRAPKLGLRRKSSQTWVRSSASEGPVGRTQRGTARPQSPSKSMRVRTNPTSGPRPSPILRSRGTKPSGRLSPKSTRRTTRTSRTSSPTATSKSRSTFPRA